MDFALDGVKWWSLLMLDGYSRTILAGAMAPSEATWAALLVLYTACLRYGAPEALISDSGGAFTIVATGKSNCRRAWVIESSWKWIALSILPLRFAKKGVRTVLASVRELGKHEV
jgi:hypothetical protein